MPAVARRDENEVDIVADEKVFHVFVHGALLVAVHLVGATFDVFAPFAANVADSAEANVGSREEFTKVFVAARADSNRAHTKFIAWGNGGV